MIQYGHTLKDVTPQALEGFFVGWPDPPTPERHLDILKGSYRVVLALEGERVVGFITAISDGVLSAYLPLLEVLPAYQGRGIGSELLQRMLLQLRHLYMVDLLCDEDLQPFYEQRGLQRAKGMMLRHYARQAATP